MSTSSPNPQPIEASPSVTSPAKSDAPPRGSVRDAALLGIVGLVAAGLSCVAIRQIGEVFQLPPDLARLGIEQIPGAGDQELIVAGNMVLNYKHAELWLGTTGVIVGGLFGLALGLIRRSRPAILVGTMGGVVFGGAFGAGGGALAIYIGQRLLANLRLGGGGLSVPESHVILMHALVWLVVGLGVGIGSGLGTTRNRWRATAQSMLIVGAAGALGGVLYPFVASLAMPLVDTSIPFPKEDVNRLVWIGLPCVIMGLALGRKG